MSREAVNATPRTSISLARKRRLHGLAGGLCGCGCERPVPLTGVGVRYDHRVSLFMGGVDDWPNLRAVRAECDAPKTSADLTTIAKVKRLISKAAGTWHVNRRRIQGRGFPKGGPKQKIQSRGLHDD